MRATRLSVFVAISLAAGLIRAQEPSAPDNLPAVAAPTLAPNLEVRKAELKSKLLLQRLASSDTTVRKSVSSDIYGSGENPNKILDAIATLVDTQLRELSPQDERSDEVAWHLKALGASGQPQYRQLIERGLRSGNETVAGHSQTAMRALELTSKTGLPLLIRGKVRVLNALEAQACALVRQQQECSSMRGADQCQSELSYQTMEAGGDAYLPVSGSGRGWLMRASVTADLYLCRGNYTKDDGSF